MNNKMKNICLTVVFLVIILGFFVINLISNDKIRSISKNKF